MVKDIKSKSRDLFLKAESYEVKPGCWKYTKVDVVEGDNTVFQFERNYPSINDSVMFPFMHQGVEYAFWGRKYNRIEIIRLDTFEVVCDLPNWHPDTCPVQYYQLDENFILCVAAVWGGSDDMLAVINISQLEKGIISFEPQEIKADQIIDLKDIEVGDEDDFYFVRLPVYEYVRISKISNANPSTNSPVD